MSTTTVETASNTSEVSLKDPKSFVPKSKQLTRIFALIDEGTIVDLTYAEKEKIASQWGRFVSAYAHADDCELSFSAPKSNGTIDLKFKGEQKSLAANSVSFLASLARWEESARKFAKETLGFLENSKGEKWFELLTVPVPSVFKRELENWRGE